MSKYVIFWGAAGSGKGTQAQVLKSQLDLVHLSTGDLLRQAMKDASELGLKAKSYVDSGNLVPDDLIIELVKTQLLSTNAIANGFILDGFPRTVAQAEALDTMLSDLSITLSSVVLFNLTLEETVDRIVGRRVCSNCQYVYHVNSIGHTTDCAACGSKGSLVHRADDTKEKVMHRYDVFKSQTEPLITYYSDHLYTLDASQLPDSITKELSSNVF